MNTHFKTAIVTGATGYIGSNLVKQLLSSQHNVICIVRDSAKLATFPWGKHVEAIVYNKSFSSLIDHSIAIDSEAIVFHLAAEVLYTGHGDEITQMIMANITFGTHLLQAMNHWQVKKIINAGTYWQFNNKGKRYSTCLYSATKQAYERLIEFYVNIKMLSCITLYVFDTYGPFDRRKKLFTLLEHAAKSSELLKLTLGLQEIEYIYITDVVNAFILAADKLVEIESSVGVIQKFAISSRKRMTLREVVQLYEEVYAVKLNVEWGAVPYREGTVMRPWLPNEDEILDGWAPIINLQKGLALIKEAHEAVTI